MPMLAPDNSEVLDFEDAAAWNAWLTVNHDQSTGAWLRIARKNSRRKLIIITDAGDVALCHGWIDSNRRSLDQFTFLQRYSPRRAGSPWSKKNAERADALIAAGRMRPSGQREIDAAKADGRWEAAYAPQKDITLPPEFADALAQNPGAKAAFDALGKSAQYALILPILKAISPEKQAARIEKAISALTKPG